MTVHVFTASSSSMPACPRYVWLPMWVRGAPQAEQDNRHNTWERLNPFTAAQSLPPVEVEVRWFDAWSMSDLTPNQTVLAGSAMI